MTLAKRSIAASVTVVALALTGCAASGGEAAEGDLDTIRLGTLVSYNSLTISQDLGLAEQLPDGTNIEWTPGFEAFVPAFEAANGGEIDGASGGLTNLFTGYAAGGDFVVIGLEDSSHSMGIVASEASGITSIDDLAGATIAVNQGGTGEYLALRALDRAGIDPSEVTLEYLAPIDGIAAFQSGNVDAIAVWDQYFATAQLQPGATIVATGDELESLNTLIEWVTRDFAEQHPEAVQALIQGLDDASEQAAENPEHVADLYERLGAGPDVIDVVSEWAPYEFEPIGEEQLAIIEQHGQDLLEYGIIDELPDVSNATVSPSS